MAQYIDKDALVAEIEKRWRNLANKNIKANGKYDIEISTLLSIKTLIDSLEVKEVDLEKELEDWLGERVGKWTGKECERMCCYFFELGLKAQKGE